MIQFREVTWYSRCLSWIFFVGIMPAAVFYMGMKYQEVRDINAQALALSMHENVFIARNVATVAGETLSDDEILSATYTLRANFGGMLTTPVEFVFPSMATTTPTMASGMVYVNANGEVSTSTPASMLGHEFFWISGYKYVDRTYTEAKVIVTGTFGASGYDDRGFVVNKKDGKVITREVGCEQAANGSCHIDRE
jgi:hypothetical protein